ncbi:hypothetical protein D1007_09424 [Hordeum vulgare]|nr:hypothetical protein D1007_09424 [Hordeum vulgare]
MTTELTNLAAMVDGVTLQDGQPDVISWRFSPNGEYSARSAYALQFEGATSMDGFKLIWHAWAPGNCRFFVWTTMLGKIMTADALLRRERENEYFFWLCECSLETPMHLFTECPWSRKIWNWTAVQAGLPSLQPTMWDGQPNFARWLQNCVSMETPRKRKGLLSLMYLTIWEISRERNRRIFQKECMSQNAFITKIKDEIILWNMAGAGIPFDPG